MAMGSACSPRFTLDQTMQIYDRACMMCDVTGGNAKMPPPQQTSATGAGARDLPRYSCLLPEGTTLSPTRT